MLVKGATVSSVGYNEEKWMFKTKVAQSEAALDNSTD